MRFYSTYDNLIQTTGLRDSVVSHITLRSSRFYMIILISPQILLTLKCARLTTNTGPDVRVCCPFLMYPFYWPMFSNLSFGISLDFLLLFLGTSYSKRVSRQGPVSVPFTTPLHISRPLTWGTYSQGSRGKRETDEKKKISKIIWLQWTWGKWWVASYVSSVTHKDK